jgi:hypothetical protein
MNKVNDTCNQLIGYIAYTITISPIISNILIMVWIRAAKS